MTYKFNRWQKAECEDCGIEYQVTRTEPREVERLICSDCSIVDSAYTLGYKEGYKQALKKLSNLCEKRGKDV